MHGQFISFHSFFSPHFFTCINVCVPCLSVLEINHSFYKAFCQWKARENLVYFLAYNIAQGAQDQSLSYF